jgi:hypothetical protein
MSRDRFTHHALEWFAVNLKTARIILATGRTADVLALVERGLRAQIAMFDAMEAWEGPELRSRALALLEMLQTAARVAGASSEGLAAFPLPAEQIEQLQRETDEAIRTMPILPTAREEMTPAAAWSEDIGHPVSIETVSRVEGGPLDSTLGKGAARVGGDSAEGFSPTHMLLAGLRISSAHAYNVELSIGGVRIVRESRIAAGDTMFSRPLFVYRGTPLRLDLLDGRVELLGLRVAPSKLAEALAMVEQGTTFGQPEMVMLREGSPGSGRYG